jgi:hypothetical protein
MPFNETLRSVAFSEALIMLRHDFEGAKIQYFVEVFTPIFKNIDYLGTSFQHLLLKCWLCAGKIVTTLPNIEVVFMESNSVFNLCVIFS